MNSCIFLGRLTRDAELKFTKDQTPVTKFCIAINVYKDESVFIKCVAWKKLAELIAEKFSKGSQILLRGEMRANNWEDKEGRKHNDLELNVSQMSFVGSKDKSTDSDKSDIPF